jgi:hypothetical protein
MKQVVTGPVFHGVSGHGVKFHGAKCLGQDAMKKKSLILGLKAIFKVTTPAPEFKELKLRF